ncbi:MAG: galactokinase [Clostridiales bacterium]|nr:galactokinase [Clostridiales bacterium]
MTNLKKLKTLLAAGKYSDELKRVYVSDKEVEKARSRILKLSNIFTNLYGEDRDVEVFSAPGRTEVGGNHTDHNHGRVLAAAINLDAIAVASFNDEKIIRMKSDKFEKTDIVNLETLTPIEEEKNTTPALIRGVCAGFVERGYKVGGFDAATYSDVLSGSGLSSSASYEVLIAVILNYLYNDGKVSAIEIAQISQYAENEFFGKPCGLMDQMACSVGGFVTIDFKNSSQPKIDKLDFTFEGSGYALCIVDTKGDHSGLNDEYAAVRLEMEAVARFFGKQNLREISREQVDGQIAALRAVVGDRALLRAYHFFNENDRVQVLVTALENKDLESFKAAVIDSGNSSFMYNQNVFLPHEPKKEPLALALCLSEEILKGRGAWRVHGGGFAGTIQAFVPTDLLDEYTGRLNSAFGEKACHVLIVRPLGGTRVL